MFGSIFKQWFANLRKVKELNREEDIWRIPPSPPLHFRPRSEAEKMQDEIDHLKNKVRYAERRADFFRDVLVKTSKERKSITPDDFYMQLNSLLAAKEAHTYQQALAHQNPATTDILTAALYSEVAKMKFLAFDSPSMTPEDAEAKYQQYLAENPLPEEGEKSTTEGKMQQEGIGGA